MPESSIANHYQQLCADIAHQCRANGRAPDAVQLLAVSKTQPVAQLQAAYAAGVRCFGENYVQEAVAKITEFEQRQFAHTPIDSTLEWHFIGPIQSNKTRLIAQYFHWVHSVARLSIAQRLSEQRPAGVRPLQVCVQVNISAQDSKSGVLAAEVLDLVLAMQALPNIVVRGLMCIPAPQDTQAFARMQQLYAQVRGSLPETAAAAFDTLSMGMSDDYPQAIAAGSTLVRIGTALFGAREVGQSVNHE